MNDDELMDIEKDMEPASAKDQALVWVSRLATGEADAAALAEFERWRDSDPRNEKALNEARALWLLLGEPLEAQYAPVMASLPSRSARAPRRRRWRPAMATAAAAALVMVLAGAWHRDWRHDQTTGTGEQRTIALGDGSTMWLNTGSAADVRVDAAQRHVQLVRGEAYFDVTHDPEHPFTVAAGDAQVTVLGTAFGVRREDQDIVVTVQRGRVQVAAGDAPAVVVTADQQVRVQPGDPVRTIEPISAEQALSWRTGRLQFENRHLGEVLAELKRYDRRFMMVSYPDADHLRVSSIVDLARIDEWYDTLEQSLPVTVTRMGPVIWIHTSY